MQPMAKFHALDLFDLQAEIADLAGHASLVAPPLASAFGTSAADGVGSAMILTLLCHIGTWLLCMI